MTFQEIIAGQLDDIVETYAPLGEVEDFVRCDDCGRLVRARPTAWQLHQKITCELYRVREAGL